MPKSKFSASKGFKNGKYIFYKSGDLDDYSDDYMYEGVYIIANDGGEANFKLTKGRFSYSDHCICFKCNTDIKTINLYNYLDLNKKWVTYSCFVGSGLKNIDRDYFFNLKIPNISNGSISKVLNDVDYKMSMLNNQISELSSLRKHLLDNLFI